MSCANRSKTGEVNGSKPDKEEVLYSSNIPLDESALLKYPFRIRVVDSVLLIWDLHARDNFFHAFSIRDSITKYLYSFGKVGQGGDELISCGGFEIKDGYLSVIETNKAILYSYSIENIGKNIEKPERIVEFSKEYVPIIRSTDMGDKGKVILDSKGEYRFILLDNNGKTIDKCYEIPNKENEELSKFLLQQLWISCLSYNQNNDILVLGTIMGDVLEIYDLNNNTAKIVVGEQGEPAILKEKGNWILMSAYGYRDIIVGDNEIYALYCNISHEEIKKAQEKGEITPSGGNIIYVFSLDGEIKKKFVLDEYINGFHIDFEKKIIYGVNSNSDIQLCVFNFEI
jgi:hypothetical protein